MTIMFFEAGLPGVYRRWFCPNSNDTTSIYKSGNDKYDENA